MTTGVRDNNDNEVSKIETNNVNDNNDNVHLSISESAVNAKAAYMMDKLGASKENEKFYLKVAWHLPDAVITRNIEIALKGHSPLKYFSWLCKREMDRI